MINAIGSSPKLPNGATANQVYAELFCHRSPARSTVVSGLLIPGARVEIDVVADSARPIHRQRCLIP